MSIGAAALLRNMLARLFQLGRPNSMATNDSRILNIYVKCHKCGEQIHLRIRKTDEIQRDMDGNTYSYYLQKTVIGNKCYNRILLRLEFDESYRLLDAHITGGDLVQNENHTQ